MDKEELTSRLLKLYPTAIFEQGMQWMTIVVNPKDLEIIFNALRNESNLYFDYLFCLTCIDWITHFTMVYHLESTIHRHTMVLKAVLDRLDPEIQSVSKIWKTAEFHEREVYDLFGVRFLNHPDLRRLFMTEEWKGWPLRKDYDDPVNMIKL